MATKTSTRRANPESVVTGGDDFEVAEVEVAVSGTDRLILQAPGRLEKPNGQAIQVVSGKDLCLGDGTGFDTPLLENRHVGTIVNHLTDGPMHGVSHRCVVFGKDEPHLPRLEALTDPVRCPQGDSPASKR